MYVSSLGTHNNNMYNSNNNTKKWGIHRMIIAYFRPKEFECQCGCKGRGIKLRLVRPLDKARGIAGIPFVITSGYRCMKHNTAIGSSVASSHPKGLAVDIACYNSAERWLIINALHQVGITRIGIGPDFIHCDIDPEKAQRVIWDYYDKIY